MAYFLVTAAIIITYCYVKYLVAKHEEEDRYLDRFSNAKASTKQNKR